MRRFLAVLLATVITLGCLPYGAAEAALTAPFSQDAAPTLLDTGRGYIAYSFYASAIYYSPDGAAWTDLSDRQWVQDARAYIALTSPMAHREFQFIWTGTEYMMRQDLRDDPRSTHQRYGDSPRNSAVTFLDEDFQLIGQRIFDSPVSDIRYADGTYYATVDGSEMAFTREEWPGEAEEATGFSDVPADAWYAQGVALCAEKGVMVGTGDGVFSPNETLSFNQCLTLALRLYDLLHGGDGVLAPAPKDWVKPTLTLTLADGTELTGRGNETVALPGVEGGRFRFGWWTWGMAGRVTRDNLHVTLEPDLEKNFDDPEYQAAREMLGQWGDALEGPATVTVEDRVISGTVNCWFPVGDWGLSFYPDDDEDNAKREALRQAVFSDIPRPDAWWRDGAWYLSQSEELREKSNLLTFLNEDCDASRWDFAQTLYEAIGELPTLRTVDVPDLERDYRSPAAYHLYEAGILTGVDPYGTFDGEGSFTRAQAAVMVARVLDESLRVSDPLAPLPTEGYTLTYLLDGTPDCGVNYPVCVLGSSEENEGHTGVLLLDGTLLPWPGTGTPSSALGPCGDYVYFGIYDEATENPYDIKAGLMDRKGDFVVPMENGRSQRTYAIEGGFFSELYSADDSQVWTLLDENGKLVREVPVENTDPESLYPPKERQSYQGIRAAGDMAGSGYCHYYVDANGNPISQKFDWASHITDDGQGFVGMDGKVYRIEFE